MPGDDRYRTGQRTGGGGFNSYTAGNKAYGAGARPTPNLGPTQNQLGYMMRDREAAARRNYTLKQMQRGQGLKFKIL